MAHLSSKEATTMGYGYDDEGGHGWWWQKWSMGDGGRSGQWVMVTEEGSYDRVVVTSTRFRICAPTVSAGGGDSGSSGGE